MPQDRDPILFAFDALLRRSPGAALVVSPRRSVAVADVDALARAAGAVLASGGLPPGVLVGLAAPNGPGMLASLLALLRAGFPALLLDAQAPAAEGLRACRALGAAGLLTAGRRWTEGEADWTLVPAAIEPTEASNGAGRRPALPPGTAMVKLTSGSTGSPRGIATSAAALVADDRALAASMGLCDDDRLLTFIPMSHSYGLSSLVMPALVRGTVLVVPEGTELLEPFAAAEQCGATVFPTVPAYLEGLLRLSQPPPWPASLRLVITAGAALPRDTARRFRETFGLPVHVFYGASECGGICYDRTGTAGERGTVGTPVEGVRIALRPLDAVLEPGEPGLAQGLGAGEVEWGVAGVVTVASPAVAAGYVPEPSLRLAGGVFVTSDVAVWVEGLAEGDRADSGELQLHGRLDDLINVKGKKVDPREVEGVLARLPGVEEAAVLGIPMPGRDGEVVRAVVACPAGRLTVEAVVAWCREHLAAHKVPRSVVLLAHLPRTNRGKLDRAALRDLPALGLAPAAGSGPAADSSRAGVANDPEA
jgi:long-chain acyl-CoA synthetase